eukprot:COSAG02_NODE_1218_length_13814_cov_250.988844_4_plen_133_part_00
MLPALGAPPSGGGARRAAAGARPERSPAATIRPTNACTCTQVEIRKLTHFQGFCFPICVPKSPFLATNSQITNYQLITNKLEIFDSQVSQYYQVSQDAQFTARQQLRPSEPAPKKRSNPSSVVAFGCRESAA